MKVKWTLEFDFPEIEPAVIRDDSKWLHNKLVEATELTFANGALDLILCRVMESPSAPVSTQSYVPDKSRHPYMTVVPDRRKLDEVLPVVTARAKAEALVRSARLCGIPDAVRAVRAMIQVQEEFIKGSEDLLVALAAMETKRPPA